MDFLPFDRMWERVERSREDSDSSLFNSLMLTGELAVKLSTAGLIAAISDDRERHRYKGTYRVVRADGIGEWAQILDDVLTGPSAQHLQTAATEERRELTARVGPESWQYQAVLGLRECVEASGREIEKLGPRVDGRKWLSLFAELRNRTRGHGALPTAVYSALCSPLEVSIRTFLANFHLFRRSWVYVHRNLSGKYRISRLTADSEPFEHLKRHGAPSLPNGVYVCFDRPTLVELLRSDVDATDFFLPNGGFNEKRFELISYVTGQTIDGDATSYLAPAGELPKSETHGLGVLDAQGKCFANLPPRPTRYVARPGLENDLTRVLRNERHPVITLVGRGGIGKTSLALSVLHNLAEIGHFGAIVWFSARDIDLLSEGPKIVKPSVLQPLDIGREFTRLMAPEGFDVKGFDPQGYFSTSLTKSPIDLPILFVFDNFETVPNPAELYTWIDNDIRLPNKILITTRSREFKGDYHVEVSGMTDQESEELIESTARSLGVYHLISDSYKHDLIRESDGHPYVIKVLLGEVAKAGKLVKVERIVANREDILSALFERTYSSLSPASKRVFLTLCNWRSVVLQVAIEAVLLRPANERMDVAMAVEELIRSSFVELLSSEDGALFLSVPLVASVFGRTKLVTSHMRGAVEADTELLHMFGAAQRSDVKHGIRPRVERMFHRIAEEISRSSGKLEEHLPMLEFVADKYPKAWLTLSSLLEEAGDPRAKDALRRLLESPGSEMSDQVAAWERLYRICARDGDWEGEAHALAGLSRIPGIAYSTISNAANSLNRLIVRVGTSWDNHEKQILVRQIAEIMNDRVSEASATDCSRIAWLYRHLRETDQVEAFTKRGLSLDPENEYCLNLAAKLQI